MKKRVAPQDVIVNANKTKEKRLDAKTKMNLENMVIFALRRRMASQINILSTDFEQEEGKVVATYLIGNNRKQGEFFFQKDRLKNWRHKNLDTSLTIAELVPEEPIEGGHIIPEGIVIFDLSLIKAIQQGNAYRIEDPFLGKIGELYKDEITEENIKNFYMLAGQDIGMDVQFEGIFAVEFHDEDYLVDGPTYKEETKDNESLQAKNHLTIVAKEQYEDKFSGVRENFEKTIKIRAQNIVKQKAGSYKTGSPNIIDCQSFIEINENVYAGNILVKAVIGDNIITFALPVEDGKLKVGRDIWTYKIEEEEFKSIVKAEMDKRLEDKLNSDLNTIVEDEQFQRSEAIKALSAGQREVQKTMKFSKTNLQDVEEGQILDLNGTKYKVQNGENPADWVLSLVEETVSV